MQVINGLAVDDEFAARMRNWARAGAGIGGGVRAMNYARDVVDQRYREADWAPLIGPAMDVERALGCLAAHHQMAVRRFWQREGDSWCDHAVALKCSDKTAKARVEAGHVQLRAALLARSAHAADVARANAQVTAQAGGVKIVDSVRSEV